jgi:hypothetical protein
MDDLTYEQAEQQAIDRQAATHGAKDGTNPEAVAALEDQLGYVRNHPITEDEQRYGDGPDDIVHTVFMWGCRDEARIILGRLEDRGWRLVRHECERGDICGDILLDLSVCHVCVVCQPHTHEHFA